MDKHTVRFIADVIKKREKSQITKVVNWMRLGKGKGVGESHNKIRSVAFKK